VIERLVAVDATIFSTYRSGDSMITFEGDGVDGRQETGSNEY
jgi:hypothetical protein